MSCRCLTKRNVGPATATSGANTTGELFFSWDGLGLASVKVVVEWRGCDIIGIRRVWAGWLI